MCGTTFVPMTANLQLAIFLILNVQPFSTNFYSKQILSLLTYAWLYYSYFPIRLKNTKLIRQLSYIS